MASNRRTFSNFLLFVPFLLHIALGANPLFHVCSTASRNYTSKSTYAANLNRLETYLYYQTPWMGFALGSIGSEPNQPFGLAQCRPDVSFPDCQTCINDARNNISTLCPNSKGAAIWYDNCLFKYMDQDFFGQIDNQNKFCLSNVNSVSDPVSFDVKVYELLTGLARRAYVSPRLFANGQTKYNESVTIYALVDCTRDLSNGNCKKCLNEAIVELQSSCSSGKQGGRIVGGSCHVGYEIYPFFNA
ncbi:hypothetical protein Droror1_Dr00003064 [Drosera rotundifolia]